MGLLHRHHGQAGIRYQMREKLFAIGDDFWVETEGGERSFKVDGKALRVRSTFVLESPSGEELFKIQEKKLHIRYTDRRGGRLHRRDGGPLNDKHEALSGWLLLASWLYRSRS